MKRILFTLAFAVVSLFLWAAPTLKVKSLACCEQQNPTCVENIFLSWQLESALRGTQQSAYEVQIFQGKDIAHKTGRVESNDQQIFISSTLLAPGRKYSWKVRVWDAEGKPSPWSETAYFGTNIDEAWQAKWIAPSAQKKEDPLPYIRKTFSLPFKKINRAVVYLCGLGASELYVNGAIVDASRILDPAQTDYEQRALYSAFDITRQLTPGSANCLGVMLGKGWYTQDNAWTPDGFSYGKPILRAQLNIEYKDGSTETIGTDESWRWLPGPILRTNVYQGEHYDARMEIADWCRAETDDKDWKECTEASGVIPVHLLVQDLPPMRRQQEVSPVEVWKSPEGGRKWIFDFGKNRTANVKFHVSLPEGVRLVTRGAEVLDKERNVDFRSTGYMFVGYQEDSYICAGRGKEEWTPSFTYHCFQYLELEVQGSEAVPDASWLTVVPVHTDVEDRGTFSCSEEQMNGLHEIARQTFLNGFVGIPVDCSHREKCGWLGDTHAYDRAANANFQMNQFWMKYLEDIRTTSNCRLENTLHHKLYNSFFYFADKEKGIPFMIAPGKRLCGVASPDWGTAVVQLPWFLYLYYGNRFILESYYDMMEAWVKHIDATAIGNIVYEGLGDWCPPFDTHVQNPTRVEFSSSCFHLMDLQLMEKTARVLGKTKDVAYYAERVAATRKSIQEKFYNPVKHSYGSQTGDAMALELGLAPEGEENALAEDLVFEIEQQKYKFLNMGIFGLSRFGRELCRTGHQDEVYKVFTQKGENSWGFMLDSLNVSTLWEGIPMTYQMAASNTASCCHPMQGGYDIWFYEDVLGIRPVEDAPGYRTILFEPTMWNEMDWAKGSLQTAYGTIRSEWKHEGDGLLWHITIPTGSFGRVVFPANMSAQIDGKDTEATPLETRSDGSLLYEFPSGEYEITLHSSLPLSKSEATERDIN